jgi:hypothetical protein
MPIIPPFIGLGIFMTTVIVGRIVQERALVKLTTEEKGRLVEAFADYRMVGLIPLAAMAALYFVMTGLDALTTATLFAIYVPAVLLFSLVFQYMVYRRLQSLKFDPAYLRAYSIGRFLTLVGFAALLLSL